LSRKEAKSRTPITGLRSKTTKARTHVDRVGEPRAVFEKELEARTRELSEAREQQAATAEVLQVISRSSGELEPVFQTILEKATRLCGAKFGTLYLYDGNAFRAVAFHNAPPAYVEYRQRGPIRPGPDTALGRIHSTKQVAHIADATAERAYIDVTAPKLAGTRTLLIVPMLKEGELVGAIGIYRQEVRPFTDKQIELVSNFANQAVIAIENTRLLNELRESLQQQTATADVLKVISRSAFDLQTVLDTLVQSAATLCEADSGLIRRREGDTYPVAATFGLAAQQREYLERYPTKPDRGRVFGRTILDGRTVHVPDILTDPEYNPHQQDSRTALGVPLLREGIVVGVFTLQRREQRPFSQKQIELVETFADQAVIAIENVRLLNELRESLQQQTATADVLKVISRSTFDLQVVLDTLVQSAARLCEAEMACIVRPQDSTIIFAANYGFPPAFVEHVTATPIEAGRGTMSGRVLAERRTVHIPDVLADPEYAFAQGQKIAGFRTLLGVPLLREGTPIGIIVLARTVARPFTDKQIELATTFADQAVIAIENVRLFEDVQARTRELSDALEQQTATSEVLRVISSSPGELEPVFQTMLANAVRICEASFGNLLLYDGDAFRHVALHNAPQAWAAEQQRDPIAPRRSARFLYRVADTKQIGHVADIAAENPDEPIAKIADARTLLIVPMLKENELIGVIAIYRQEVRPFNDKQIELIKSFARSSRSRTPAFSTNCANRSSSRRPLPMCSRLSVVRPSISSRCCKRWLNRLAACVRPTSP
jgi:GAF domain-containing protein